MQHNVLNVVSKEETEELMHLANSFRSPWNKPPRPHRDKTLATIFQEPSTRTKASFITAAQKLGMNVVKLDENNSMEKGETLIDTLKVLDAMDITHVAIRTSDSLVPLQNSNTNLHIINAGDSTYHPTQALGDILTLHEMFDWKLSGKSIAIVGDIIHSRVARSVVHMVTRFGMNVVFCGPEQWLPIWSQTDYYAIHYSKTISIAEIQGVDVIMTLRPQFERMQEKSKISFNDYRPWRLNQDSVNVPVMHPGPVSGDRYEITQGLKLKNEHIMLSQVTNGMYMRMALLHKLS